MVKRPSVGLAVIIKKGNTTLLGKRRGSHGEGTWNCPGGHLEYGESFEDCARREVKEETGLSVINLKLLTATNDMFTKEDKHYITLFMTADYVSGTPVVMEPEKCDEWKWFAWDDLPEPLFLPLQNLVRQGFNIR